MMLKSKQETPSQMIVIFYGKDIRSEGVSPIQIPAQMEKKKKGNVTVARF